MKKTNSQSAVSPTQVKHIADLSNIPISDAEASELAGAFAETLEVVDQLKQADISAVEPTHQVTGLENILRADEVVSEQMFSQAEALANADQTHEGYFVVSQVIDKEAT